MADSAMKNFFLSLSCMFTAALFVTLVGCEVLRHFSYKKQERQGLPASTQHIVFLAVMIGSVFAAGAIITLIAFAILIVIAK